MSPANFDWTSLEDIRPALLQNAHGIRGHEMATIHLQELERVGLELGASLLARENAKSLATGYDDVVVVLLEPSDKAERVQYDEMMAFSKALKLVDETLALAFEGQRGVNNTIIIDRRPFRSAEIQNDEDEETRKRNNQKAYQGFEAVLAKLRPKVIVLCQCEGTVPRGQLSDRWSSSVSKAGDHDIVQLSNGHECFCVYSFHPMHFDRYIDGEEEPLKRVLSEYLFDATPVAAANLLAGRELSGFGLSNLKDCARNGPVAIISGTNVVLSYRWMTEQNCCSEEVWAFFEDVSALR
jgi:hypothetical protein